MYKARVYKIINDIDNAIYIGSTKQNLSARMAHHRASFYKNESSLHNYVKKLGDWKYFHIILIKEFDCQSHQHMIQKEQEYIDKYMKDLDYIVLNKRKAYQTKEQRKKQQLENSQTEKRKLHKKIYDKKYSQTEKYKQYHKQYNQTEKYKQYHKQYSQKIYYCSCSANINFTSKYNHKKSKRHQLFKFNPLLLIKPNIFN